MSNMSVLGCTLAALQNLRRKSDLVLWIMMLVIISQAYACKDEDCSFCGGYCDAAVGCICPNYHCAQAGLGGCSFYNSGSQFCQCPGGRWCGKYNMNTGQCQNVGRPSVPQELSSPPVHGIQRDVWPSVLSQCAVCHEISYGYSTSSSHVEDCKARGNFIVFAAKYAYSSTLSMVAGLYTSDLQATSSTTMADGPFNGAYWYYNPSQSVGFASRPDIYLNPMDASNNYCSDRVSWQFGWYASGRVGCSTYVWDNNWRKIMYACNVKSCPASACNFTVTHDGTLTRNSGCNVTACAGELVFKNRNISRLDPEVFANMSYVASLDLSDNHISEISPGVFDSMQSLSTMDLSNNPLSALGKEVFQNLSALHNLNMRGNSFTHVPVGTFTNLSSLQILDLSYSQITGFSVGAFADLRSLQTLDLSDSQITGFSAGTFADLRSLQTLDLSYNKITELKAGVFEGLTAVTSLNILGNNITQLWPGAFRGLDSVQNLDVSFLKMISILPAGAFSGLQALTCLDLSSSLQITELPAGCFNGLSSLQILRMVNCNLSKIADDTFQNMSSLQSLDLSSNKLTKLTDGVFSGLSSLNYLYLYGNRISELTSGVFSNFTFLWSLDLSWNQISELPPGIFKNLYHLSFYGNPLTCMPRDTGNNGIWSWYWPGVPMCETCGDCTILIVSGQLRRSKCNPSTCTGYLYLQGKGISTFKPDVFSGFVNMTGLGLSYNQISALPAATFQDLTSLEMLQLGYNQISELPSETFQTFKLLLTLELSFNQISVLPAGFFDNMQFLQNLYLHNNKIAELPPRLFYNLSWLREIYLTNNQISELPSGLFNNTVSLYTLDLSYNQIIWISPRGFKGLSSLQNLYLQGNKISDLPPQMFKDLPFIWTLDLSSNQISGLPAWFVNVTRPYNYVNLQGNTFPCNPFWHYGYGSYMPYYGYGIYMDGNLENCILCGDCGFFVRDGQLQRMDCDTSTCMGPLILASKGISNFRQDAFTGLSGITKLDISNNKIHYLPNWQFKELSSLTFLGLHYNQISALPAGIFAAQKSLRILSLHHNQLTRLPAGIFQDLESLKTLSLHHNLISILPPAIFRALPWLKYLDLNNNQISTLPSGLFNGLTSLKELYLQYNQFPCFPRPPNYAQILVEANTSVEPCDGEFPSTTHSDTTSAASCAWLSESTHQRFSFPECAEHRTWLELSQTLSPTTFYTGGLADPPCEDFEVWACFKGHQCLDLFEHAEGDSMCYVYHEEQNRWYPWGLNSELSFICG